MALVNINEGLKEEYSMNKTFSAEYAIARVKRKGLMMLVDIIWPFVVVDMV